MPYCKSYRCGVVLMPIYLCEIGDTCWLIAIWRGTFLLVDFFLVTLYIPIFWGGVTVTLYIPIFWGGITVILYIPIFWGVKSQSLYTYPYFGGGGVTVTLYIPIFWGGVTVTLYYPYFKLWFAICWDYESLALKFSNWYHKLSLQHFLQA